MILKYMDYLFILVVMDYWFKCYDSWIELLILNEIIVLNYFCGVI